MSLSTAEPSAGTSGPSLASFASLSPEPKLDERDKEVLLCVYSSVRCTAYLPELESIYTTHRQNTWWYCKLH